MVLLRRAGIYYRFNFECQKFEQNKTIFFHIEIVCMCDIMYILFVA